MAQISFVVPDHVSFSTVYTAFQSIGLSNISLFFPPSTEAPIELISPNVKKEEDVVRPDDLERSEPTEYDLDVQPMEIETWDIEGTIECEPFYDTDDDTVKGSGMN